MRENGSEPNHVQRLREAPHELQPSRFWRILRGRMMFGFLRRRSLGRTRPEGVHFQQQHANSRRANVLNSMLTIRILLRRYGCDVDRYSDQQIADALLEATADSTQAGFSPWHLNAAAQRLGSQR